MYKNILFDIGSVLLAQDWKATVREFAAYSGTIPAENFSAEHVFLPVHGQALERGEISQREYFRLFLEISGCRLSFRHYEIIWNKNFSEIRPMIELGQSLAGQFGVYFLSNTNPSHVPGLYSLFPSLLFRHGEALSYRIGALKPEREFYGRALDELGLAPEECLFIDDKIENVQGALEFGLSAIHHLDPLRTRALVLEALGLDRDPGKP